MLALLCNFESAAEGGGWQALVRVPDRCGAPRPVGSVQGALGEPIALPPAPPGTVLIGRVHGLEIGPSNGSKCCSPGRRSAGSRSMAKLATASFRALSRTG